MDSPFFTHPLGELYCGDALAVLRSFQPQIVDLCVTSPPYYDTRSKFRHPDALGLEPDRDAYEFRLGQIFAEIRRVLKPEGVLWLVIDREGINKSLSKPNGWYLHRVMLANRNEFIAVFSIGPRSSDDLFRLEPWKYSNSGPAIPFNDPVTGRVAMFPPFSRSIPRQAIKHCCPEGGTVLDPFMGQGTTIMEAIRVGRRFLGVEISSELCEHVKRRVVGHDTPCDTPERPGTETPAPDQAEPYSERDRPGQNAVCSESGI